MQYTPYLIPFMVSAVVLAALTVWAAVQRGVPGIRFFGFAMAAAAAASIATNLSLAIPTPGEKIRWVQTVAALMGFLPVLTLAMAAHHTGARRVLSHGRLVVLLAAPSLNAVLVLTSGLHRLSLTDLHVDGSGVAQVIRYSLGPWDWVQIAYGYLALTVSAGLLARSAARHKGSRRRLDLVFLLALCLPLAHNMIHLVYGNSTSGIDFTPVTVAAAGVLAAFVLQRVRASDIAPVASRTAMDATDDIVVILDARSRVVDANPRARAAIGLAGTADAPEPVSSLPPPWAEVLAAGGAWTAPTDVQVAVDGRTATYLGSATALHRRRGRQVGRVLVLRDISEHRRAEQERDLTRERLQLAFDSANDGLWDWNVPTGVSYYSPRYYTMLGYEPDSFPASYESWKALLHPDDLRRAEEDLELIVGSGRESFSAEWRMRCRDGSYRWILSRAKVVERDAAGAPVRIVGTQVDITERHEMEDALRESENRFRGFVEQSSEGIILTDEQGTVIEFNGSAERVTGLARSQALGRSAWDVSLVLLPEQERSPERLEQYRRVAAAALTTGTGPMLNRLLEGTIRRRDGTAAQIEQVVFPIQAARGFRLACIVRDVTERRRSEEELRASQLQLQQAQKVEAVGRLAGGVAHDFNNLLTVIIGYCDLAAATAREGNGVSTEIEEIRKAAQRAANLTRQLLAFSRRQVLKPRIVALNDLVQGMGTMLTRVIGEDIELRLDLDPETGTTLADPGQIEQVVMNMAVNARDAMPEGGLLTIATRASDLDERFAAEHPEVSPGAYVMLEVADTGHGMDAATLERVFEPFFTTKEPGKGTGLGLPMAYGIVKQSDGYIYASSRPGEGTRFTVYLPRVSAESPDAAVVGEPEVRAAGGAESILLVEDEPSVRGYARLVLTRGGYHVLEAENGEHALKVMAEHSGGVDLLLTDVVMPRMGGHELAKRLAVTHPATSVLFVSGYTEDATIRHGVATDATAFIAKPYDATALLAKVREVLEARKPRRA